jgi:hypothetical protein
MANQNAGPTERIGGPRIIRKGSGRLKGIGIGQLFFSVFGLGFLGAFRNDPEQDTHLAIFVYLFSSNLDMPTVMDCFTRRSPIRRFAISPCRHTLSCHDHLIVLKHLIIVVLPLLPGF